MVYKKYILSLQTKKEVTNMQKERLSVVDSNFCDQILKYGSIKEDYSFRLDSKNKRQYVIEYEGDTYYLTKTDGFLVLHSY